MITLSVVIPTFRGAPGEVIERLNRVFDSTTLDIIVVDDGSGPDWVATIRDQIARHENVSLISLPTRRGQAYATLVGVASSQAQTVATMDDDGEHPVAAIPEMLSLLRGSVDLVFGTPIQRKIRGYRRIGTFLNNCLFSFSLGKPWRVPVTSFRVLRRELLLRALRRPVRFPYLSAMLFAAGAQAAVYRYRPIAPINRTPHESRYHLGSLLKLYLRLLFHWGPFRLFSSLVSGRMEQFG